jgi:O-antigen ligase
MVLAVFSFIFSIYKHDSLYALMRLAAYIGLYYLIVNNFDRPMTEHLIVLAICTGSALSIYGLLQYFGVLGHSWWMPREFLAATYVNHNHFSGYLELVIPATIGALLAFKGRGVLLVSGLAGALALMVLAFVFAQSRGAWISLLLALFVMNAIFAKRRILGKKGALLFILLVILVFSFICFGRMAPSKRIEAIAQTVTGEASPEMRLEIWRATLEIIRRNPVTGTGIGTFIWAFTPFRPEALNDIQANFAHNDYLEAASEMGLAAPVIMVWLLAVLIGRGFSRKRALDPLAIGCAAGVLSLAAHSMVDFNFHIPANMLLFIVFAAFLIKEDVMSGGSR